MEYPSNLPCPTVDSYAYKKSQKLRFLGNQSFVQKDYIDIKIVTTSRAQMREFFKFYRLSINHGVDSFTWMLPLAGNITKLWNVKIVSDVVSTYIGVNVAEIKFKIEIQDKIDQIYWISEDNERWVDESIEQWTKE